MIQESTLAGNTTTQHIDGERPARDDALDLHVASALDRHAMTRDEVLRRVLPSLESRGLRLAVLFGSAARGALRPDSDVDVAILPSDLAMTLDEELALQASLERATGRTVDLVRIDRASTLLKWRIAREGVAILAAPAHEWPRFVARAGIEHGDFAPLYARTAERLRRRIAGG